MSIAVCTPTYQYGVSSEVITNVFFVDESTVIYPSGRNLILHNMEMHSQKFIPQSDKSSGICGMCISPNKRYFAISEILPDRPAISIFDLHTLRKRKILSTIEITSKQIECIAFSPDSKYILTQGGDPDWTLIYWVWEKSKILATVKSCSQPNSHVYQVSFNPQDNTQVCVIGEGVFKIYRYNENSFKQVSYQKIEVQDFRCHAWLTDDKLVVGTVSGKIMIFDCGELKLEIDCSSYFENEEKQVKQLEQFSLGDGEIRCIASHGKSFFVSCGRGFIQYFERNDFKDGLTYRRGRQYIVPPDVNSYDPSTTSQQSITCISLSPQESSFVCTSDKKQIFTTQLSTTDIAKLEVTELSYFSEQFHSEIITGMDVCIRKPMMATCSIDRAVQIWNLETNNLEHYKCFAEEAFSIALHPSGLYICVGFSDKLRLMNILIDDIRTFLELPIRGCKECSFSNGGHLFAVVSGNLIQIFSSTTFENIINLKGHNGKVRNIIWALDDTRLFSCGMDGAIYEWEISTGKRINESVIKSCSYNSICIGNEDGSLYAVGNDKKMKKIMDSQIVREIDSTDSTMTSLVISKSGRMMFAGLDNGSLRIIKFPLTIPVEWSSIPAHSSRIVKLKISHDDEYLISTSEDGTIIIWSINDKQGRKIKKERDIPFAEEILITKTDLQEKNTLTSELKIRVEEMKMENEYQIRLKDMSYNEKIQELTDKFIQEMESLKTKNQVLKSEKDKLELQHTEMLNETSEKHNREFQELETANNQKLMLEYEKLQELQSKSQRMQEDYEWQLNEMEKSREKDMEQQTEYYERKMNEKNAELDLVREEAKQQSLEYEETKKQIEEDADHECIDLKNKYERKLKDEKQAYSELNDKWGTTQKKYASLENEIDEHKDEMRKSMANMNKLNVTIRNLEKDILGLKKEVVERDETIQDKEKRIYDLKKKNQELEKFKFVLDYKIKELKKQIEPRENEIRAKNEQIQEMESELERFSKQNETLTMQYESAKDKIVSYDKELKKERQKIRDTQIVIKRFKTDLHNCVGYIQDPQLLKEAVRAIHGKYQCQNDNESAVIDGDIQKEYSRQQEHLQHNINSLRKKLVKDTAIHKADNIRIMQDNVSLLGEINQLRKELKLSRIQVHDLEAALGLHRKANKNKVSDLLTQLTRSNRNSNLKFELQQEKNLVQQQKLEMSKLKEASVIAEEKDILD